MVNDTIMTGIPVTAVEKQTNTKTKVDRLEVDQYVQVGSYGYAKNLKMEFHVKSKKRFIAWKEDGKAFIGRVK